MVVRGFVKKGEYFDSVTLMRIAAEVTKMDGIVDSAVVMGTGENISILKNSNLFLQEFKNSKDNDLLIAIKADSNELVDEALKMTNQLFADMRKSSDESVETNPSSLASAIKKEPEANVCLISIAGKYAGSEAKKALDNGLNVMLFSDNVSIETELKLKKYAKDKGLLVMGPDCGTAIINGVPLAFANVVPKGNIGIVAASGTGAQEVSSVIANSGAGVSQCIGTGGRDVKTDIGGIMVIEAMRALAKDPQTEVLVIVSKPPSADALEKIAKEIKNIQKPVVGILIGGDPKVLERVGAIAATNLEEAGLIAAALSAKEDIASVKDSQKQIDEGLEKIACEISKEIEGKYLRGLFSGGTLCDETQLLFREYGLGDCYGNAPLNPDYVLEDVWRSKENTIIDMGEDEFTVGRPHPMIDFSLRKKKLASEAQDPNVAIIMMDVVLGYGSNLDPAKELCPEIKKAKTLSPKTAIICSICGTDGDPQGRKSVKSRLQEAGAVVLDSNAQASRLVSKIIGKLV